MGGPAWLVAGLLLFAVPAAGAVEQVVLQLRWTHAFQFAGYYAAAEQGYYREAGIEVRFEPAHSGIDPVQSVLSGEADFGVGTSSLLLERHAGRPVVALAVIFQHSPMVLITPAVEGPSDLSRLRGERVMIEANAEELLAYLEQAGLGTDRFVRVGHSQTTADLVAGRVAAMSAYDTHETWFLDQANFAYEVHSPREAGIDFYGDNLFTTERMVRERRDLVERFRHASVRGWQYAMTHTEETVRLIHEKYAAHLSPDFLRNEARLMADYVKADLVDPGYMSVARWQQIASTYAGLDLLPAGFPLEGFLYETDASASVRKLYQWMVVVTVLLGLVLGVAFYIHRINRRLALSHRVQAASFQALQASEAKYRELVQNANSIILKWNSRGEVLFLNEFGQRFFGYSEQEIVGRSVVGTIVPEKESTGRDLAAMMEDIFAHPERYARNVNENRCRDGRRVWVSWSNRPVVDEHGEISAIFSVGSDITGQKHAEDRLRLAATVFSHAMEGIMIVDTDTRIVDVNEAFTRLTGYSRDEVLGRRPSVLQSGRHGPDFYAEMWRQLEDKGYWQGEIWNRRKNGQVFAELINITAVNDADGNCRHYVALFSDITEQKQNQQRLQQVAHYDTLTGLPNRLLLADRLRQAMAQTLRRGLRLAVAYLDLDGFKAVNDNHGHQAGDRLLHVVATRMRQALREGDTLARIGGDEFVAVLVDLEEGHDLAALMQRLLAAAGGEVEIDGQPLRVSASLGLTFFPQDVEVDAEQLLRQADQAMYQAKLAGKNRYQVFDTEEDRFARGLHEDLQRLAGALQREEFELHYQPQVNMRTGEVVGVEALLRWRHPELGLLAPAAFLPQIKDHPLMVELGDWATARALDQVAAWKRDGLRLKVNINVGGPQLQRADFAERVCDEVAGRPGIEPGDVGLEILESSTLENVEHTARVIAACRAAGVTFALDDFGTGYASLTYLKHLPVECVKLDRSYLSGILDDPEDLAIVTGVLGLASAFRRRVIAEGVETMAHGRLLLLLGCDLGQGYGIAYPMPAAEVPSWVARWRLPREWREAKTVSRDDLPVLFAQTEHRAWVRKLVAHLGGQGPAPVLGLDHCRFGAWLRSSGRERYGEMPMFRDVEVLHEEIHARASELLELNDAGRHEEAASGLGDLQATRDAMLERLDALVEMCERVSGEPVVGSAMRSATG